MIARVLFVAVILSLALVAIGCNVPRPTHPAEGRVMGPLPIVSLDDATIPMPSLAG
jgi:hypothetical protein